MSPIPTPDSVGGASVAGAAIEALTIAIPTYNRPRALRRLLELLRPQPSHLSARKADEPGLQHLPGLASGLICVRSVSGTTAIIATGSILMETAP